MKFVKKKIICKGDIVCGKLNLISVVLSCLLNIDQDLSHMGDDEPYDYKFVKWMIKEKVFCFVILGINKTKHSKMYRTVFKKFFFFKYIYTVP